MKRILIRVVVVLLLVEVAYLAVANVVLNLPATQSYLNQLRPERITYKWDRAWTWIPFRVHITGFSLNGQSWVQQWQLTAPEISGSLGLLPLFAGTLHFGDIETADIDLRFRPRPSPDRDDSAIRPFYPTIEGRNPDLAADPVPTQTPGWKIVADVANITGQNQIWFGGTRLSLDGDLGFLMTRQNRNGPLSLADGRLDAAVKSLNVDGRQIAETGTIKGTFDVATYLPQENRRLKVLPFLTMDLDIDLPVDEFDFLDFYLKTVSGLKLAGNGSLKGHVGFDKGNLIAGTNLAVIADTLAVDMTYYSASGAGSVAIEVDEASPDTLDMTYRLSTLSAFHEPAHETLFTGENLEIDVERVPWVVPGQDRAKQLRRVVLTIPKVTVPDIKAYQSYLPDRWNANILGGTGSLEGRAEISVEKVDFDLTLGSENASVQFETDSFETGLKLGIKAVGEAVGTKARVDISGTYLDLDDSLLKTKRGDNETPWQVHLAITEGEADFNLPEGADVKAGDPSTQFIGFWSLFHEKDMKALLATLSGKLKATLTVSDLNWVNELFKNPYSLAIYNSAEATADLVVTAGFLDKGSTVTMPPTTFKLEVLDYVGEGTGGFDLVVEKGGSEPDVRLDANLTNASLRLQNEKAAVIDDMKLSLTARALGVSVKDGGAVKSLDLSIPSATVTDMSAYNEYLPKGSPIRILGGKADLAAQLKMAENAASGFVKLNTSQLSADLDGERISGTVVLDAKIIGGSAQKKTFDIGGTSLQINNVRLSGAHATDGNWSGRVDLSKGQVEWKKPMSLDMTAGIRMTDVQPLLAFFEAHRKSNKWIDRIFDLKDVRGNATLRIAPGEIVVPYALAKSDTIEVGAKGIFRPNDRQGMYYLRYNKFSAILEMDGSKKRFAIIGATRKFDEYKPGGPLPGLRASAPVKHPAGEARKPFSLFKRK